MPIRDHCQARAQTVSGRRGARLKRATQTALVSAGAAFDAGMYTAAQFKFPLGSARRGSGESSPLFQARMPSHDLAKHDAYVGLARAMQRFLWGYASVPIAGIGALQAASLSIQLPQTLMLERVIVGAAIGWAVVAVTVGTVAGFVTGSYDFVQAYQHDPFWTLRDGKVSLDDLERASAVLANLVRLHGTLDSNDEIEVADVLKLLRHVKRETKPMLDALSKARANRGGEPLS